MGFPRTALASAGLVLVAGCGGGSSTAANGDVTWGDGQYAVVLAHDAGRDAESWRFQARQIADLGTTVVAVRRVSPRAIAAAVDRLHDEGHRRVALVGGGTGADAVLRLSREQPDLTDQLVLISPNKPVPGRGEQPKLFLASTDDAVADVSRGLATASAGADCLGLLFPGSAHGQAIFDADDGALPVVLQRIAKRAR